MPPYLDEASELLTWLTILSIICGALAVLARFYTRWLRDLIRDEISTHTALIQPTSNGGKSLPDVAAKLDKVLNHLGLDEHPTNGSTD